jgi:hypothetical protein
LDSLNIASGGRTLKTADALLVIGSLLLTVVVAEGVTRALDGQPLFAIPLPEGSDGAVTGHDLDAVPRVAGVSRDWFFRDPPPLPNRTSWPEEWESVYWTVKNNPERFGQFRPPDIFKAWSPAYVGDPCKNEHLRRAPGDLHVLEPSDAGRFPTYRFLPNATTPLGLVTNQIGWRGPPIAVPRGERTIRIVFVGASTTVGSHNLPYSYPEFLGPWLDLWAASKHLDVRFETLNAGRESIDSRDIAAIVHNEVLPLRPDLVVYYEGANQFDLAPLVPGAPRGKASRPTSSAELAPAWLRIASNYLELARRVGAVAGYAASDLDGREWPKADYRLIWPEGLNEADPDLSYPDLPVQLTAITRDLDHMRKDLATIDAEFALSSFFRLAKDGLVLNPIRHRLILEDLNIGQYPFRYRDIERLTNFENRVFAKYATTHHLPFIDVARDMPRNPDLMIDSIHPTGGGVRVQAWVVLQQLIPVIEKRLSEGAWPTPRPTQMPALPTFKSHLITPACGNP